MSIIETVSALLILMVFLLAMLGSVVLLTRTQVTNRTRTQATLVGSQMAETARSLSYSTLKVLDDGTVPATYTEGATTFNVVKGTPCAGCLPYKQNVVRQGVTYAVTQLVLENDSYLAGDGTTRTDKRLIVDVAWTVPRPATYRIQTIIHNTDDLVKPVIQGVRFEIKDPAGEIIADSLAEFNVKLANGGNVIFDKRATEGVYQNFSIAAGGYTCTVTSNPSTQSYFPAGSPGNTSTSASCNVIANVVTLSSHTWDVRTTCPTTGSKGDLVIQVLGTNGSPIQGASVTITPTGGGGGPGAKSTDATGKVTFNENPKAYNISITKSGYNASSGGAVCIMPLSRTDVTQTMTVTDALQTPVTLAMAITNQDKFRHYQVTATNKTTGKIGIRTIRVDKNDTKTATIPNLDPGTYTVAVCILNFSADVGGGANCNQIEFLDNQQFITPFVTYNRSFTDDAGAP